MATGQEIDSAARKVIEQAGYGAAFGHALGHGLGLSVHEPPRLGPGSDDLIKNGMVFTVEPGVYLSGWGGVRLEDDVLVTNGIASII
jgi:Xaa-Pro aminopeptidase